MTLDKLKLSLNPSSDNYQYIISQIVSVDDRQDKDAMSIALPGQSYKNNILLGITGQEAKIDITFNIHNDGTDKANGSYTSTVTTINEQIEYLKDVIQDPSFTASWQLDKIQGSNVYNYSSLEVFQTQIRIPTASRDSPKWRECIMSLTVGEGV